MAETFIVALHPAVTKEIRNLIFSSLFHVVFQLLVLALATKHRMDKIGILVPGSSKKALGPGGILLKKGTSGDKPTLSKEGWVKEHLNRPRLDELIDCPAQMTDCQWLIKQYLSYIPPTGRMWHKAFLGGSGRKDEPQTRLVAQKYFGPRRHLPKEERLRFQLINPAPSRRAKAWGTASWCPRKPVKTHHDWQRLDKLIDCPTRMPECQWLI